MMAEADTDKDGEVDLEEFKLIMRGAPKAEKGQAAAERAAADLLPATNPAEGLRRQSVAAAVVTKEKADLALAAVKAAVVPTAEDREKAAKRKAAKKQGTIETWVSCDECGNWRRANLHASDLHEEWNCNDNPDARYNRCDKPQELSTEKMNAVLGLDFSTDAPETAAQIHAHATDAELRGVLPAPHKGAVPNPGAFSYKATKAKAPKLVPDLPPLPDLKKELELKKELLPKQLGGGKAAGSADDAAADGVDGAAPAKDEGASPSAKPPGGFFGGFFGSKQPEAAAAGGAGDGRPTLLITGTSGWIGKLLAQALVADGGMRVVSLSKQPCDVKGVETVLNDL